MSSPSEPQPPAGSEGDRPPSTQEIPIASPTGATAAGRSLPPHPDAAPPAAFAPSAAPPGAPVAAPVTAPQPTGPVDFVPGLPGLGTPPVPPPATTPAPPVPTADPTGPAAPAPAPEPAPGSAWPETLESEAAAPGRSRHVRRARGPVDRTALIGVALAALALVLVLLGLSLDFGGESLWSTVPLWSAFASLCAAVGLLAFAVLHPAADKVRRGSAWSVAAAGLLGLAVFWLLVVLPNADTDRGFLFTAALGCLGGALWTGPRTRA